MVCVLHSLFEESNILFENGQTVWRAISDYKNAKLVKSGCKRKQADFPDALIANKALYAANVRALEFSGAYTFDVAAQEIPQTKKP
ncbi:MAG: putative nucleic-acid-binding protein [Cellvibrionaceae bacterium]|jgi:predicted nucleic-acid-binding protein